MPRTPMSKRPPSPVALAVPPVQALAQEGGSTAAAALAVRVTDDVSFAYAGELLKTIKTFLLKVDALTDPVIKAAHLAHKAALDQKAQLQGPGLEAERHVKGQMAGFEAERRRLAAEAARAAEAERQRLEAEERERVRQEEARLLAEAQARQAAEIAAAVERGDGALAERLASQPVEPPSVEQRPVFVAPPAVVVPKVDGVTFSPAWSAVVTDLKALVDAVAAGTVSLGLVQANQVALNQMAKALKRHMHVPGVEAVEARVASVTNKR